MKLEFEVSDSFVKLAKEVYGSQSSSDEAAVGLFIEGWMNRMVANKEAKKGASEIEIIAKDYKYNVTEIPSEVMAEFVENAKLFYPKQEKAWLHFLLDTIISLTNSEHSVFQMTNIPQQYLAQFQQACREVGYDEYTLFNSLLQFVNKDKLQILKLIDEGQDIKMPLDVKKSAAILILLPERGLEALDKLGEQINKNLQLAGFPSFPMNAGGFLGFMLSEAASGRMAMDTQFTKADADNIKENFVSNERQYADIAAARRGRKFTE